MVRGCILISVLFVFVIHEVSAQNIYELRKLTEDQWLEMSTDDRLEALSINLKEAQNQTFLGDFGKYGSGGFWKYMK